MLIIVEEDHFLRVLGLMVVCACMFVDLQT